MKNLNKNLYWATEENLELVDTQEKMDAYNAACEAELEAGECDKNLLVRAENEDEANALLAEYCAKKTGLAQIITDAFGSVTIVDDGL